MGIILRLLGAALTGAVVGMVVCRRTDYRNYAVLDLEPLASPADVQLCARRRLRGH